MEEPEKPKRPPRSKFPDAEAYLAREDALKIKPLSEFKRCYEILKKLGNSAFSEVSLVENRETQVQYAAKAIQRTVVSNPTQIWTELRNLQTLEHPSLARLYDAFASEKELILLFEYVPGGDLYERIKALDDYGEARVLELIKDLLDAIDYLHNHKVVHKSIKPENLLFVDPSTGPLKIADAGVAGLVNGDSLLSSCVGTPKFVSPEVLRSSPSGPPADIWNIGVLTYFLLAGKLPFRSSVPFRLYDRILTANYKFGEEFDKLTPESADFIKKCLTVDPKLRVTAKQALAHKWFSEAAPEASISRDSILQILEERRSVKAFKPGQLIVSAAQDPVEEGDIDPPPVETPESEAPKGEAPPESEQPPKEEEPAKGEEDE